MGARNPRELVVWQLLDQLRTLAYEFTSRMPASLDGEYCSQIREAVDSAVSNVEEGFYSGTHRQFGRYLRISRGSLGETQGRLKHARKRRYLTEPEFGEMWRISVRAMVGLGRLYKYLRTTPDPDGW